MAGPEFTFWVHLQMAFKWRPFYTPTFNHTAKAHNLKSEWPNFINKSNCKVWTCFPFVRFNSNQLFLSFLSWLINSTCSVVYKICLKKNNLIGESCFHFICVLIVSPPSGDIIYVFFLLIIFVRLLADILIHISVVVMCLSMKINWRK